MTDVNAFLGIIKSVIQQSLAEVDSKKTDKIDFPVDLLEGKGLFPSLAEFIKFMKPLTGIPLKFGESNEASVAEFSYGYFVSAWLKYVTYDLGTHIF